MGAVALVDPPGLGVNAEAARSLGFESYRARNGSASCHVSPLSDAGIRSTTRTPATLAGGCGPCWSCALQAANTATATAMRQDCMTHALLALVVTGIYVSSSARGPPGADRDRKSTRLNSSQIPL